MAALAFYDPKFLTEKLGFPLSDANTIIDLIGPNVPISPATSTDLKVSKGLDSIDADTHLIRLIIKTCECEQTKTELTDTRYNLRVVVDELDQANDDLGNANVLTKEITENYRRLEAYLQENQKALENTQSKLQRTEKAYENLVAESGMNEESLLYQIRKLEARILGLNSLNQVVVEPSSASSSAAPSMYNSASPSFDPEAPHLIELTSVNKQLMEYTAANAHLVQNNALLGRQVEDLKRQLQAAALANPTPNQGAVNHGATNAMYMAEIARLKQEMASMAIVNQKKVDDLEEELKAWTERYEQHIRGLKATHAAAIEALKATHAEVVKELENERNTTVYANAKLLMELQRYDVSVERLVTVTVPSPTPSAASLSDDEDKAGMDIKPAAQTLVQTLTKALSGTFTPVPPTTPPPAGAVGGMSLRSGTIAGGGGVATAPSIKKVVAGKKEKTPPGPNAFFCIACKPTKANVELVEKFKFDGSVHWNMCSCCNNADLELMTVDSEWIAKADGHVKMCGHCLNGQGEPLSEAKVGARNAKMGFVNDE